MQKETEGTGTQALFDKINELVRQGHVRRIVVSDMRGRKVLDLPITAGVVAAVFAPMIMAAGAALALVGGWRIRVENTEPDVVDEGPAAKPTPEPTGPPEPTAGKPAAESAGTNGAAEPGTSQKDS